MYLLAANPCHFGGKALYSPCDCFIYLTATAACEPATVLGGQGNPKPRLGHKKGFVQVS